MSEKKPLDEAKTSRVLADVLEERRRQHEKWGEQNLRDLTPDGAEYDLIAEVDEMRRLMSTARPDPTWALVLLEEVREVIEEPDPAKLRAELVQVAAVAVQWIEAIDRRRMQQQMDEAHERSLASLPPHQQAFARIYEEAHRNQAALERRFGLSLLLQVCPPPGQVVAMDFSKFEHTEPLKVGPLEVVALGLDTGPESFTARQRVSLDDLARAHYATDPLAGGMISGLADLIAKEGPGAEPGLVLFDGNAYRRDSTGKVIVEPIVVEEDES